ncbi:MAG: hypothetical protein GX335_04760 [Firmicutes bacterium]|nr:hypothetical protein [Bacillota bacterium]
MKNSPLILIVGVCASGKTTLSQGLRELGFNARSFAQEHSVSGRLWRRLKPDVLIVLDCRYETIRRRKTISWGKERYRQQQALLKNARLHSTLIIKTDQFTPAELIAYVQKELELLGIYPSSQSLKNRNDFSSGPSSPGTPL